MVYALFSQGFRLGGEQHPRGGDRASPLDYEPDKMNNYEIGLKSKWLDRRLLLNVTAFRMQWDDIQLQLAIAAPSVLAARHVQRRQGGAEGRGALRQLHVTTV